MKLKVQGEKNRAQTMFNLADILGDVKTPSEDNLARAPYQRARSLLLFFEYGTMTEAELNQRLNAIMQKNEKRGRKDNEAIIKNRNVILALEKHG